MEHPYDHLLNLSRNALFKLHESTSIDVPVPIVLWLTMVLYVVGAHKEPSPAEWLSAWLDETIVHAGIESWSKAREIPRSIVWVDFIHDRVGEPVFEAAMLRLKNLAELNLVRVNL